MQHLNFQFEVMALPRDRGSLPLGRRESVRLSLVSSSKRFERQTVTVT